jgi:hypothetical protein
MNVAVGVGAAMHTKAYGRRGLTSHDEHLFTRVAYAMVVTGLWHSVARRDEKSFDYFEINRREGNPTYRVGRLSSGGYVVFHLDTGVREVGNSLSEVLRDVAYVPRSLEDG